MIRGSTDSAHASFHELADLVFLCLHRFEKRLYWTGVWHVDHPVHRTFPILQWPNVISLLLLEHMPPTTPPLQHHIHCCSFWSYPAGLEGGGKRRGRRGITAKCEFSNWHLTLWTPWILHLRSRASGSLEKHTHLYHSYTARSQLYVCVDGSERTKWLN